MTYRPVVVSGATGAGKTTLCQGLARLTSYRVVNVGDVLHARLLKDDLHIKARREIGPRFLEHYGEQEYLAVLSTVVTPGVLMDGVRLAMAPPFLRRFHPNLLHIHRLLPPSDQQRSADPYEDELPYLRAAADIELEWCDSMEDLGRHEQDLASRLQ